MNSKYTRKQNEIFFALGRRDLIRPEMEKLFGHNPYWSTQFNKYFAWILKKEPVDKSISLVKLVKLFRLFWPTDNSSARITINEPARDLSKKEFNEELSDQMIWFNGKYHTLRITRQGQHLTFDTLKNGYVQFNDQIHFDVSEQDIVLKF